MRNARSPPVWTSNQSSATAVPVSALVGDRRNPVPFETRLAVRVDDGDPGAVVLRVMQVLRGHRLVVRHVGSEQHDEIGLQPIRIAARRGAVAEHLFHRDGRGGMAQARGVVHVIGPHETRELLRRVVRLVGEPSRRQVHRESRRVDRAQLVGYPVQRLVPRDAVEARLAARSHHRVRKPAELAQLARRPGRQRRRILEHRRIEGRRRVQPHQLETHHAQVRSGQRPVGHAGGAERAAIAHAVTENAPGEGQLVPVLPGDPRCLEVVVGLLPAEAERTMLKVLTFFNLTRPPSRASPVEYHD